MSDIWRIQTKPASKNNESVASFFIQNNIAAVGWSLKDDLFENKVELKNERSKISNYKEYEEIAKKFYPEINNVKRLAIDLKENDLIWMRYKGIYYLAKINKNSDYKFSDIKEHREDNDSANQRTNVKWYRVGDESSVPGKVATAFIRGKTLQRISKDQKGVLEFSQARYNEIIEEKKLNEEKYKIEIKNDYETFFNYIRPEECEDLLCMLLLKKYGYIVIPSTNKLSTELYECILLNSENGNKIYIQVKNGNEDLKSDNYKHLIVKTEEVYLLTIKGKIDENSTTDKNEVFEVSKNIFGVNPQKLYEFVMDEENKNIIPENIKNWIDYIKTYSNK